MRYYFSIQIELKRSDETDEEERKVSSHSVCAFLRAKEHAHVVLFFSFFLISKLTRNMILFP